MKTMKRITRLIAMFGLVAMVAGCQGKKEDPGGSGVDPTPPGPEETEFSVSVEVTEGLRDRNGVKTAINVEFIAHSTDPAATYMIEYTINGGPAKTVSSIWDGKSRSIYYETQQLVDYGVYIIKGYMCSADDKTKKKEFEKTVWMKYVPVQIMDVYFSSEIDDIAFENAELNTMETGELKISFSPKESAAEFIIEADDPATLQFDQEKAYYKSGMYCIPYTASDIEGRTPVRLTVKNGDDVLYEKQTNVTVKEGIYISKVDLTTSCDRLLFKGNALVVNVSAETEYNLGDYRVDYYIDEEKVYSENGVSLPYADARELSTDDLSMGEHVFTVVVDSDKYKIEKASKSNTFCLANPELTVYEGHKSSGKLVADVLPGETATVGCNKEGFEISISGIPEGYVDLVDLSDEYEPTSVDIVNGRIRFMPEKSGEGNLLLKVVDTSRGMVARYNFVRQGNVMVNIEYSYGGGIYATVTKYGVEEIDFITQVKYHGYTSYVYYVYSGDRYRMDGTWTYKSEEISLNPITKTTRNRISSSGSTTCIMDLSEATSDITSSYVSYQTDSDEGHGYVETITGYAYYRFILDSVIVTIKDKNFSLFDSNVNVGHIESGFPDGSKVNINVSR